MDLTHFSTGMALRMGCILDDLTSDECSIDVNITVDIPSKPRDILEYYISLLYLALSISVFMAWWTAFRGRWVVPWEWKLAGTPGRDLPEAENRAINRFWIEMSCGFLWAMCRLLKPLLLPLWILFRLPIRSRVTRNIYLRYQVIAMDGCLRQRVYWVSVVVHWSHSLEMRRVKRDSKDETVRRNNGITLILIATHLIAFQCSINIQIHFILTTISPNGMCIIPTRIA